MAKKIRAVIRIMWVFMALALVTLACVSITFVLRCIYYVLPFTPGFLYFQEFGTGVIIPMSFVGASFFGVYYDVGADMCLTRGMRTTLISCLLLETLFIIFSLNALAPKLYYSGLPLAKVAVAYVPAVLPCLFFFWVEYGRGGALASGFDGIDCIALWYAVRLTCDVGHILSL